MSAAHRQTPGSSFRFDRRFRGVGRINIVSGALDKKLHIRLDAMLSELYEDGRIEILRAIRDRRLTALEVYAASRAGRLSHVAADVVLFRNLWESVDRWLQDADIAAATADRYNVSFIQLRKFKVLRKGAVVRDLERVNWRQWKKRWPNSPADWNRMRAAVSRLLTVLLEDKYHPFRRRMMNLIPRAKEPTGRVPDIDAALFWRIIDAAGEVERASFVALAVTGLRAETEYVALREHHLMPHTRSIRVPGTKTEESAGTIRVGEQAWEWVVAAVPSPYAHSTLYKKFKAAAAAVGSPELTLHDLRHLKGMLLAEAGVPESIIQDALRHRTPGQTRRYTRTVEQGKAGRATDKMMFDQGESA